MAAVVPFSGSWRGLCSLPDVRRPTGRARKARFSRLTNECAWNAVSAFANCGRAVAHVRGSYGRVEDGRGSLGHSATLRFPTPLIEPDVPISGIRLSDWLHLEAHGEQSNRTRLRY